MTYIVKNTVSSLIDLFYKLQMSKFSGFLFHIKTKMSKYENIQCFKSEKGRFSAIRC